MRRALAVLIVALGLGAALWILLADRDGPRPDDSAGTERAAAQAPDQPLVTTPALDGRPRPGASPREATPIPTEGSPFPAEVGPDVPPQPGILDRWAALQPRAPDRGDRPDPLLGDPTRTPQIARSELLGGADAEEREPLHGMTEVVVDTDASEQDEDQALVTAIRGAVADPDGLAIPGAEVILYSTFYQRHVKYDNHVREVGRALTDGSGVFDLRPIRMDTVHFGGNGEILVTIRHPRYASIVARRLDNIQPEIENDLGDFTMAVETLTLTGTIRDRKGDPVEGAILRDSGNVSPIVYDKTERLIILKDCPTAVTDADGAYRLENLQPGRIHLSITVNIDCVWHGEMSFPAGEHTHDHVVLAGGSVRGYVRDAEGTPLPAAVIYGGGNWTHSNADGSYWLDNIEDGPFALWVTHHEYRALQVAGVESGEEERDVVLAERLPRVTLVVTDAETDAPVELISIDWTLSPGGPPGWSEPESPFWNAKNGRFEVIVPDRAVAGRVTVPGYVDLELDFDALADGAVLPLALERPGED